MSSLTATLIQTSSYASPGIGFYSYIVQTSTGNYYDTATSTFVPLSAATAPAINFVEAPTATPTDTWSWTVAITLPVWSNDYYMISSFQVSTNMPAATPYSVYIFNGMTPADYAATFTAINQNTGGTNNLQYVDPSGNGIGGATINIYTLANYNAGILAGSLGTTTTNPDGTWTDSVMVPSGNTYAIQFFLSGVWGPDVIELTV